jgi:hypothetical protein
MSPSVTPRCAASRSKRLQDHELGAHIFFGKRIRQTMKVFTDFSRRVRQLRIKGAFRVAVPSTTRRKFYPRMKKDESPETDLQTENMVSKAVCYRTAESGRIITGGAITTPYLAINWQREHINARYASRDQRFPTPPPQPRNNRENARAVTTSHLLLSSQRGKAAFSLPISQPNSNSLSVVSARRELKGRRGGSGGRSRQKCHIDKLVQKIYSKWRLPHHT